MIAQLYHTMLMYSIMNGPYLAWFVFSFISAFFIFIFSFGLGYWYRKKSKPLGLGLQVLYFILISFATWFIVLLVESLNLRYLFSIWKLVLVGLAVYIPIWFVYNKILDRWEKLPWMLVQFFLELVVALGVWYYLIFVFQIFGDLSLVYLM